MVTATLSKSLIDLEHDELRPVADICEKITGRRPAPQCIWRWRKNGCRGVRLECVLVHGVWQTTSAAFAAFVRGQTEAAANANPTDPANRSPQTERRLQAVGLIEKAKRHRG